MILVLLVMLVVVLVVMLVVFVLVVVLMVVCWWSFLGIFEKLRDDVALRLMMSRNYPENCFPRIINIDCPGHIILCQI